jgi:hypothetical protein
LGREDLAAEAYLVDHPLGLQVLGLLVRQASLDLMAVLLLRELQQEADLVLQPEVAWQLRRELARPLQVWEMVGHLAPISMVFAEFVVFEVSIHVVIQLEKDCANLVLFQGHHHVLAHALDLDLYLQDLLQGTTLSRQLGQPWQLQVLFVSY